MASYFYSPETKGFYVEGLHKNMPEDVFSVPEATYALLMEGQALGKQIVYKSRKLRLEDQAPRTVDWDVIRLKRDTLLTKCDWTQIPDAQLDNEVREAWKVYRQALRDLTESFKSPDLVIWPKPPINKE